MFEAAETIFGTTGRAEAITAHTASAAVSFLNFPNFIIIFLSAIAVPDHCFFPIFTILIILN